MKLCIQWSRMNPQDWEEMDSSEWASTPSKPAPVGREVLDDSPGWIQDLCVQGVQFGGADHYAVEDLNDGSGGIRVTEWNDDPNDHPFKWGVVWNIFPLAPDPKFGGAINTRQFRVVYTEDMDRFSAPVQHTVVRPWSEFVPPAEAITRHGIWISAENSKAHEKKQHFEEWRDWGQHLDPSELDNNGQVKIQRKQGKYSKPKGTKTFFLYDSAQANGIHTADNEFDANETDIASSTNQGSSIATSSAENTHVWVTVAGKPGDSDWPSGDYRCQIDVQAAMDVAGGYGFRTLNSVAGHFARVNSGITSDLQTFEMVESAFSGTGLKLATTGTIDPTSGATGDLAEWLLVADNTSGSMTGSLTVRCDDSDSFMDGPWVAGGGADVRQHIISAYKAVTQ